MWLNDIVLKALENNSLSSYKITMKLMRSLDCKVCGQTVGQKDSYVPELYLHGNNESSTTNKYITTQS